MTGRTRCTYNFLSPIGARAVSVAQLAEHQTVALAVVGSIPITHPTFYQAPVAQGIEHRPPEPGAEVRFLPGAPFFGVALFEESNPSRRRAVSEGERPWTAAEGDAAAGGDRAGMPGREPAIPPRRAIFCGMLCALLYCFSQRGPLAQPGRAADS